MPTFSYYLLDTSLDCYLTRQLPVRLRFILTACSRSQAERAFNQCLCGMYPDEEDYQWFNDVRVSTSQAVELTKSSLRLISAAERADLLQVPGVFDVQNMPPMTAPVA